MSTGKDETPPPLFWVGEGNFGLADGNASLAIGSRAELELLCPCREDIKRLVSTRSRRQRYGSETYAFRLLRKKRRGRAGDIEVVVNAKSRS